MSGSIAEFFTARRVATLAIGLTLLGCVIGILVPAGLGWDFANFYDAGRRIVAGEAGNLYLPESSIGGLPPQGTLGFFGTPLSAVFYAPMGMLSPEAALMLFKLSNVLAILGTCVLLFQALQRLRPAGSGERDRFLALFSVFCLSFQPFWTIFRVGGQATPLALVAMVVGLGLLMRDRLWPSAGCFVLAVLLKPALAPAVGFLGILCGLPFFLAMAGVSIVTAAVSIALLGLPVHIEFVRLLIESGGRSDQWFYNSSLFILPENFSLGMGHPLYGAPQPYRIVASLIQLVAVLLVAWLTVRAKRASLPRAADRHVVVMLALLLFLLMSKTIWEQYLEFLFPALAYLLATRERFRPSARVLLAAICALCVLQNVVFWAFIRSLEITSLAGLMTIAIVKSGPLLLTVVFLARHWDEWLATYTAPEWRAAAVRS